MLLPGTCRCCRAPADAAGQLPVLPGTCRCCRATVLIGPTSVLRMVAMWYHLLGPLQSPPTWLSAPITHLALCFHYRLALCFRPPLGSLLPLPAWPPALTTRLALCSHCPLGSLLSLPAHVPNCKMSGTPIYINIAASIIYSNFYRF